MKLMPYLIDGHNLIPKIAGLSLTAIDDEMQLIELLQEFCRQRRKQVEVYFDNAPPGHAQVQNYGSVKARFVRSGQTADGAIRARLAGLGRSAKNWTVVSSDRMVQAFAREARAQVLTSEEFAAQLAQVSSASPEAPPQRSDTGLTPEEVEEWLNLFKDRDKDK